MSHFFPYTSEQLNIIKACPTKDYRVIAVPGSGKSWVTIEFAGELIDTHNYNPSDILMVTFSLSATQELRSRLAKITSKSKQVNILTLHSLCFRICKDRANGSPYAKRKIEQWSEWQNEQAVRDFLRGQYHVKAWEADKLTREIVSSYKQSKRWPKGQWIEEHEEVHPVVRCPYAEVFAYIEKCKEEAYGIEFDDMPQFALELLNTNEKLREHWQQQFKYIIVDEFQDTDRCQYAAVIQLAAKQANMLVVGDIWQSVYGFRGAVPELMAQQILQDRAEIVDMPLSYNFRSGRKIIAAANNILQPTRYHTPQKIEAKENAGDGYLLKGSSPLMEFHLPKLAASGIDLHEIAILNRYNADTLEAEACCIKHSLPYVVYGENYSLHKNVAVNTGMDYLRLIYHTDDMEVINSSFLNTINVPLRKIPKRVAEDIIKKGKQYNLSAIDYIIKENGCVSSKEYINIALRAMADNIKRLRSYVNSVNPTFESTLIQVRRVFDLDNHFKNLAGQNEDPEASLNGVQKLLRNVYTTDDLNKFLETMKKLKGSETDKKNRIQLLTGHKAKGLEFEAVFVHAEEDRFPKKESNIEEERNLFYVMLTRAKSILYLSGNSQFVEQAVAGLRLNRDIRYDTLWSREPKQPETTSTTAHGELPFNY